MVCASPVALPDALRTQIDGAEWQHVAVGRSDAQVFRLSLRGEILFLKTVAGPETLELAAEAYRIGWLNGRLPVPQVRYTGLHDGAYYLLMTAVPGQDASQLPLPPDQLTRRLADGLKTIHSLNIADCPFDHRLEARIAAAKARLEAGLIDAGEFDAKWQGHSAEEVFAALLAARPNSEDLVFTHGDYCLPNVMINPANGQICGYIDLGRAGVADRHQDIALCARSLAYNLSDEWVPLLFETYGIERIDPAKIAYYQLLDELF